MAWLRNPLMQINNCPAMVKQDAKRDAGMHDGLIVLKQHEICGLPGDVGRRVDRNADVG